MSHLVGGRAQHAPRLSVSQFLLLCSCPRLPPLLHHANILLLNSCHAVLLLQFYAGSQDTAVFSTRPAWHLAVFQGTELPCRPVRAYPVKLSFSTSCSILQQVKTDITMHIYLPDHKPPAAAQACGAAAKTSSPPPPNWYSLNTND